VLRRKSRFKSPLHKCQNILQSRPLPLPSTPLVIRHSLIILLFDAISSGLQEGMTKYIYKHGHIYIYTIYIYTHNGCACREGSRRKCSLPKQQITARYFKQTERRYQKHPIPKKLTTNFGPLLTPMCTPYASFHFRQVWHKTV
jgi:hypothetical protein